MLRFVFVCGLLLIAISVGVFMASEAKSPTIWIPAALGALIAFRAWWARQSPGHMTVAVWSIRLVSLLGLGACIWQLSKAGFDVSTLPRQAQAATAVLTLAVLLRTLRP